MRAEERLPDKDRQLSDLHASNLSDKKFHDIYRHLYVVPICSDVWRSQLLPCQISSSQFSTSCVPARPSKLSRSWPGKPDSRITLPVTPALPETGASRAARSIAMERKPADKSFIANCAPR